MEVGNTKHLTNLQLNPKNPRTITAKAFEQLKAKIKRNPDGLTAQRIVYRDNIIVAGNQRWRAVNALGLELNPEWFKDATGWTDEQIREYIISSNLSDGDWDWDILSNEWDAQLLEDWGLTPPIWKENFEPNVSPSLSTSAVTEEQIQAKARQLAEQMVKERSTLDAICPECGNEFEFVA